LCRFLFLFVTAWGIASTRTANLQNHFVRVFFPTSAWVFFFWFRGSNQTTIRIEEKRGTNKPWRWLTSDSKKQGKEKRGTDNNKARKKKAKTNRTPNSKTQKRKKTNPSTFTVFPVVFTKSENNLFRISLFLFVYFSCRCMLLSNRKHRCGKKLCQFLPRKRKNKKKVTK